MKASQRRPPSPGQRPGTGKRWPPARVKKWIADSPTMRTTGPVSKGIVLEHKALINYQIGVYKIGAPRGRLSEPQKKHLRELYDDLNQLEIRAGIPLSQVTRWPAGLVAKKAVNPRTRKKV